ncbi:MAG: hypothetical protein D6748_12690 [Calditrichaeota bacterium]|nr:MAG: hypothetical protein D6748_12690 [Calditrichota bacterium]
MKQNSELTLKKIFIFWVPLAATWLMMSVEGPFLSALIARLPEAKYNLAAYGVAFALALFIEAPIIMMMSASTALVEDKISYLKLRNFIFTLNFIITLAMLTLVYPPVFEYIAHQLLNLHPRVSELTHLACLWLLPWPAAIGFRRFYQGILIRHNQTRKVAFSTVIRLCSMTATAMILFFFFQVPGVMVGAAALGIGVSVEALASRWMTHSIIHRLLTPASSPDVESTDITYRYISQFYFPLALTPMLALGAQPIVTFFMSHGEMALESLAIFPVMHSLVFIFRSMGLSFMEVAVALAGKNLEGYRPLRTFALLLGSIVTILMGLIAFTPLSTIWYHHVSGLSLELTQFALFPTQIFSLMPALTVLVSFQRGILVNRHHTTPITLATILEVFTIVLLLWISIDQLHWVGAVGGVVALVSGRLLANLYLHFPLRRSLKSLHASLLSEKEISHPE